MRSAIRILLADFERAICRDRCHAIMAAPAAPEKAELLDALENHLSASLPTLRVSARGVPADRIDAVLVERLGQGAELDADGRLLAYLRDLSTRDSALALLLDDAHSIPRETLRHLGRLALQSDRSLRLALFVASEGRPDADAIAEVVTALGVGAQKIQLDPTSGQHEMQPRREADGRAPDASAVARAPLPTSRQAMRITARAERPAARWPRRAGLTAALALALLGAHRLGFDRWIVREAAPEVARVPGGDGSQPLRSSQRAAEMPSVAVGPLAVSASHVQLAAAAPSPMRAEPAAPREEYSSLPGEVRPAPSASAEVSARPLESARSAPEPAPPPVRVSLNARPWARVEVDGREVGITPLAGLELSPGSHRFRVHLADGRVIERTLRIDRYRNHISFP